MGVYTRERGEEGRGEREREERERGERERKRVRVRERTDVCTAGHHYMVPATCTIIEKCTKLPPLK